MRKRKRCWEEGGREEERRQEKWAGGMGLSPLSIGCGAKGRSVCPARLDVGIMLGILSKMSLKAVASRCEPSSGARRFWEQASPISTVLVAFPTPGRQGWRVPNLLAALAGCGLMEGIPPDPLLLLFQEGKRAH